MVTKRRQENFEEFKKTEAVQGHHKDGMLRLKEREDCFLRIAFKEVDGRTKRQIEEDRKKEMLENNMKKFGKVCIGVHGKELPKYSDLESDDKAWWKQKRGYTENPMYKSHKILSQD